MPPTAGSISMSLMSWRLIISQCNHASPSCLACAIEANYGKRMMEIYCKTLAQYVKLPCLTFQMAQSWWFLILLSSPVSLALLNIFIWGRSNISDSHWSGPVSVQTPLHPNQKVLIRRKSSKVLEEKIVYSFWRHTVHKKHNYCLMMY